VGNQRCASVPDFERQAFDRGGAPSPSMGSCINTSRCIYLFVANWLRAVRSSLRPACFGYEDASGPSPLAVPSVSKTSITCDT
jgi:hypothetical protein